MCAAVSDYKPAAPAKRKMKKRKTPFALKLIPTRDVLASLPKKNRRYLVVGFAAETHDLKINAQKKLRRKNCDLIVANDVSRRDAGMESDENEVIIFFRNGESQKISRTSKKNIARELVKIISKMLQKSLTKKS
jgi:phosphopantothenoylcysteine decarboxylase/phosphopantothenate--cysteine ligase